MLDVLLDNGLVVDGLGGEPFTGTVGLRGDTVAHVGRAGQPTPRAATVIGCDGLVVCPGFVDLHTHSDLTLLRDPLAASKITQGVTTEVTGNCGFSPFPAHPDRRRALAEFMRGLGTPDVTIAWPDLDGYAAALLALRPVMNVAPLVGHGALRIAATGTADVPVDATTLAVLRDLLRAELEQGAFGLSTGLTYVPSMFAGTAELHALAGVLPEYDALYATHARATPTAMGTYEEAVEVGRRTAARVQYSHVALNDPALWGRADEVIGLFAAARDDGVDIGYDVYPYAASASSLTQYLPAWLQEQGEAGIRGMSGEPRLFDRACRELALGLYGTIPWDWSRVLLSLTGPGDEDLQGRTVAEAAARRERSPEAVCVELCARHGNAVQAVLFYRDERDVAAFLAHPLGVLGSDGSALSVSAPGQPHPRSFGAHARLFERYVRERPVLELAEAVRMCTSAPAARLGLRRRGALRETWAADVVVLDLAAVHETGTWSRPKSLATGVRQVWVNGVRVLADGRVTGAGPGRVLRRGVD